MGNGANCTKVKQFDESVQMPSISPMKHPSTSSSSYSTDIPSMKPPPPPKVFIQEERFAVKRNTEHYGSIWDYNAKLAPTFQQSFKTEFRKVNHHQKETLNTKWATKASTNLESTHIESVLNVQTHSCINLSTSEKIDELIQNLNRIHAQIDESIQQRTKQISAETESVLAHIMDETQQEQQRLLSYAKEQQNKQDEHYRELLQNYISQLDQMKVRELTQLQEELQTCREEIMQVSQMKIKTVNEQANITKSKIVKEEQQQASMKIDAINAQLQNLSSDETYQQLGSETMTKTNVTTSSNVGTKAVGQNCSLEFGKDAPIDSSSIVEHSRQTHTKTTSSDIKSEHREEVITQIEKKIPINPQITTSKVSLMTFK